MPGENTVSIRKATASDLDQMLVLSHEFHEFHVRGVPDRLRVPAPYDDVAVRDMLMNILRNENAALFVAHEDGQLVGLAEVYLHRDTPHPAAIDYVWPPPEPDSDRSAAAAWAGTPTDRRRRRVVQRARRHRDAANLLGVCRGAASFLRSAGLPDDEADSGAPAHVSYLSEGRYYSLCTPLCRPQRR